MINTHFHLPKDFLAQVNARVTDHGVSYISINIMGDVNQVDMYFKDNDHLAVLSDAINAHFVRTGYIHHPDERKALNAELDDA